MASNQPNLDELYKMGVKAARNDQRQPARMMFEQVLDRDSDHVRTLLWMAKISSDPEERAEWLYRVLEVEPDNKTALKVLDRLEDSEDAERNRMLLRVGAGAYAVTVFIIAALIIISAI